MTTLLVFGWLVSGLGSHAFLIASVFGVVALGCVIASLMLKPTKGDSAAAAH